MARGYEALHIHIHHQPKKVIRSAEARDFSQLASEGEGPGAMDSASRAKTLAEDGLSDSPAGGNARWGATRRDSGERGGGGTAAEAHGVDSKGGSAAEYLLAITMSSKNKTAQMLRSAAVPGEGAKVAWAEQGSHGGSNASSPARALTLSTLAPSAPSAALPGSEGRLHTRIAELERQLIEEGARVRHLEAYARSKDQQVGPSSSLPPLLLSSFPPLLPSLFLSTLPIPPSSPSLLPPTLSFPLSPHSPDPSLPPCLPNLLSSFPPPPPPP